jgi:hypothetical protein
MGGVENRATRVDAMKIDSFETVSDPHGTVT